MEGREIETVAAFAVFLFYLFSFTFVAYPAASGTELHDFAQLHVTGINQLKLSPASFKVSLGDTFRERVAAMKAFHSC